MGDAANFTFLWNQPSLFKICCNSWELCWCDTHIYFQDQQKAHLGFYFCIFFFSSYNKIGIMMKCVVKTLATIQHNQCSYAMPQKKNWPRNVPTAIWLYKNAEVCRCVTQARARIRFKTPTSSRCFFFSLSFIKSLQQVGTHSSSHKVNQPLPFAVDK